MENKIAMPLINEGSIVELDEAYKIKVRASGEKRKVKKCPSGYKPSPDGSSCVKIGAKEKISRKKGAIRGNKKKVGQWNRIARKQRKAMARRKSYGL
jgi:hypothetical protein